MNEIKSKRLILPMKTVMKLIAILFLATGMRTNQIFAQQPAPVKAKTTQSKKTPAKKNVKKIAKKPQKAGSVFICDGVGGYTYHSYTGCVILKKCKGRVLNIPLQQATGQFSCKKCKKCN